MKNTLCFLRILKEEFCEYARLFPLSEILPECSVKYFHTLHLFCIGLYLMMPSPTLMAQEVQVGSTVCGSSINTNVPARYDDGSWNGGKNNSWSLLLYKQGSLVNSAKKLVSLSFFIDCGSSKSYTTVSNQRIYIKETTLTALSSNSHPDLSSFTKVYDGSITWKRGNSLTNSKNVIRLQTPFQYSGTKSLLIYFENESGIGVSMFSSIPFLWDHQGNNTVVYTQYKASNKTSSTGSFDKTLPVTSFTFENSGTPPNITLQSKAAICGAVAFQFTGVTATNYTSLSWSTATGGSFNDATLLNPMYTPSAVDVSNGSVVLTLHASNTHGTTTANYTLDINQIPTAKIIKK